MHYADGKFKSVRDKDIYYQTWNPEDEIKAGIIIVHGLGEHSGRYSNVVNHMLPRGYALYGFDHIGHGKSGGQRELVESFADYTDTLTTFAGMVKAWLPDKPIFLLGHSMGGLITSYYLLDHSDAFRGAVISAPAITVPDNINQGTIAIAKLLSKIAPKMGMMQLDANEISKDPEVVRIYLEDPLVFTGKTPVRLMAEMLKAMIRVDAEMEKISLPIIIVQGSRDTLALPVGAEKLSQRAGSEDKTLKVYEGLYHEVFNEPERDRVLEDVAEWLDGHL
ncbi:MAG: lysophospholipase [Brevefilum sp.]|jgi:acylglycerol lipase